MKLGRLTIKLLCVVTLAVLPGVSLFAQDQVTESEVEVLVSLPPVDASEQFMAVESGPLPGEEEAMRMNDLTCCGPATQQRAYSNHYSYHQGANGHVMHHHGYPAGFSRYTYACPRPPRAFDLPPAQISHPKPPVEKELMGCTQGNGPCAVHGYGRCPEQKRVIGPAIRQAFRPAQQPCLGVQPILPPSHPPVIRACFWEPRFMSTQPVPQMRTYTTRGPRDFLNPSPPCIGY